MHTKLALPLALFLLSTCDGRSRAADAAPTRRALARAIADLVAQHDAPCGCAPAHDSALVRGSLETLFGTESDPLDRDALARCLRDVARALDGTCRTLSLPRTCDLPALSPAGTPSMFAREGAPCSYALCAEGLHCQGDEETACVPGAITPAEGSFCARPVLVPSFAP